MTDNSPEFTWKEDWQPDILATLMFIVRDGEVLLIRKKRGIGAGKINAPGGKFEPGETALQCALRETEEEVHVKVLDPVEMGEVSFSFQCGATPEIHGHVFLATRFEGTPAETEEALPQWVPLDKIPYEEMWEDDRYWLPHMLAGRKFNARFVFEGDRMISRHVELL